MKKNRKIICLFLISLIFVMQIIPVYAEQTETEWYEMVEESFETSNEDELGIVPYTAYIVDVVTSIAKISSGKVGLRADVLCSSTMSQVTLTFYLQKKSGSTWVNVSQGVTTSSNVSHVIKQMTVSGVSSGSYRAKVVAKVTDKYGFSESLTGFSGAITI